MNVDFAEYPDYEVIVGSHLYGVATEGSDVDYRGFVLEPPEAIFSLETFEQREFSDSDRVIYSLRKFLKLLIGGNINVLEVLFANDYARPPTDVGQWVRENRNLFLSKAYYRSIRGFAGYEWNKALAITTKKEWATPKEADLFAQISGQYNLTRLEINDILDTIFETREGDPRKTVPTEEVLGEVRRESFDKYGYCTKNAYHAIRLLGEGIELLNTGRLTFPRPESEFLKQIRAGDILLSELQQIYDDWSADLKIAYEKSILPKTPNVSEINKLYSDICKETLL